MSNTYKVAIPRLASLEPEAVEKFEERYSELEGVDGEDAAAPIALMTQKVKDEIDVRQLMRPINIRPATQDGSNGAILKWPEDYRLQENAPHLFTFLQRHSMPEEESDQEALLRSLKISSTSLEKIGISDISSGIGNFKRRAAATSLAEKTKLSIFLNSFLSPQLHLQTHVKDKKPTTIDEATKAFLTRLGEIEKARRLLESSGLIVSSTTPKNTGKRTRARTENKKTTGEPQEENTPTRTKGCIACSGDHAIRDCPKGPWTYTEEYKIVHEKTGDEAPNKTVPNHLKDMADRYRKYKESNNRASELNEVDALAEGLVHMGVALLPGAISNVDQDNLYKQDLFWDSCATRSMLDPDVYNALVQDGATPITIKPIQTTTWTGSFKLHEYINVDVTLSYPVVPTELTFTTRMYKGPKGTTAGSISHTDMHRTGLDVRLAHLMERGREVIGQHDKATSSVSEVNKRATINIPTFQRDSTDEQVDGHEDAELGIETNLNKDDELPVIVNDKDNKLYKVLRKRRGVFPKNLPKKPSKLRKMKIILIDPNRTLPYRRARRLSAERRKHLRKEVDKLLKDKIIRKSLSPTASWVVLVRKPNGSWRFTVAFKDLNAAARPCAHPLPRMDDILNNLKGRKYYTTLDLRSGYHQMELDEDSRYLTAFVTPDGLYEYCRVPQGFFNSPAEFSAAVIEILGGLIHTTCEVYIDDIVIFGDSIEELAENMDAVLGRLEDTGLAVQASKCVVGATEIKYLGHIVNSEGLKVDPARVAALKNIPPPRSVKDVRSFLGCCQFVRAFVQDFARVAKPLTTLLKQNEQFRWGEEQKQAFMSLKERISDEQLLAHFDPTLPTQVRTDASKIGIGAVLLQQHGESLRPVAYLSKTFNKTQQNWHTVEQECFAIYHAVTSWRHYLLGHPFSLLTDNRNLTYIHSCTTPKVIRWAAALMGYNFSIRHLPGQMNITADCLSRMTYALAAAAVERADPYHDLITLAHDSIVGHGGVHRTIRLLDRWGYNWPTREKDVRKFVRECPSCQATEDKTTPPQLMELRGITREEPFARLAIDLIGRYPVDELGNTYILLAVCSATRFVELIPIKDKKATTIATALLQLFGRYGPYKELHSDRGSEFVNDINDEVLAALNINRSLGVAHRPQTNGQAERHVQETTRHVRHLIYDDQSIRERWSAAIPIVQRIQNATVLNPSDSPENHVTPVGLMFAGRVTPDRFLFGGPSTSEQLTDPASFVAERRDLQDRILKRVQHTTRTESQVEDPPYKVHDMVMLKPPTRPIDKLAPKLQGPFRVTRVQGNVCDLYDSNVQRTRIVYADRLRRWHAPLGVDPAAEAAKTHNTEYVVERVLEHKRTPGKRGKTTPSKCTFKIKWMDFAETTWEPYTNVKDTAALDEYLTSHTL